ncbi:hypothetical protein F0562_033952 [Nyssa sinensis]|uniref:F-box domain-containing protein n=1 Tax=Nyssa sinensis TaxID=561372 RepID=A0A5J5AGA6_9ASTE|nr:hypothetical protein F0562_033952 [Nyssa sinensis]
MVKKKVRGSTKDIISNLPGNIIENILMCLPILDVVRTSVLSRKWRYNWVNLPQLVFDDTLCDLCLSTKAILMYIYQVLLLHRGPILKFTLSISGLESCFEIDQFILFLSRNGVQEFTLYISEGEHYKLPSSLFSCLQLTHLNLETCVFKPPRTFEGFSRLTSLEFYEVLICADTLASLISGCPLLDRLTLESSAILDHLEIVAPNLKFLCFVGLFKNVRYINTPLLAIASINLYNPIDGNVFKEGGTSNMIMFFDSLPIENLDIEHHYVKVRWISFMAFCLSLFFRAFMRQTMFLCLSFGICLKSLAAGGIPERLPTTLDHLKILKLSDMSFGELDVVACALLLIRSSPNLNKVIIEVSTELYLFSSTNSVTDTVLEFLKVQGYSDVSWSQLREVEMRSIHGLKTELELIKLLLANSPVLENILIEPHKEVANKGLMILKEVTRFRRASPNAEITYRDPNEV